MSSDSEFQQAVLNIIAQIPEGRVSTYGQIARMAGRAGAARAVGRYMRMLPQDTQLPWHRVLNARGEISIPHQGAQIQREKLESEGVVFISGRLSLAAYEWRP